MATLIAYKSSDTSRASVDTVVNDPVLTVSVTASTNYSVKGLLIWGHTGAGGGDARIQFNTPGGAIMALSAFGVWGALFDDAHNSPILDIDTSTTGTLCWIQGAIRTVGSGGTLGLGWGQSNSNANATILRAGSWIKITEV